MIKVALINSNGEVVSIIQPGHIDMYQDGKQYGDYIAKKIPYETNDQVFKATKYLKKDKFKIRKERFSISDEWDNVNEKWKERDIAILQNEYYNVLKQRIYDYITLDCDFPEWKQLNYIEQGSVLGLKNISSTLDDAESNELNRVEQARLWKNSIMIESKRVKAAIYSSPNVSALKIAVNSFVFNKPPFLL